MILESPHAHVQILLGSNTSASISVPSSSWLRASLLVTCLLLTLMDHLPHSMMERTCRWRPTFTYLSRMGDPLLRYTIRPARGVAGLELNEKSYGPSMKRFRAHCFIPLPTQNVCRMRNSTWKQRTRRFLKEHALVVVFTLGHPPRRDVQATELTKRSTTQHHR